jgi:hypothetical protein
LANQSLGQSDVVGNDPVKGGSTESAAHNQGIFDVDLATTTADGVKIDNQRGGFRHDG